MKTFDFFDNRDFIKTGIQLSLPKLKLQIPYLANLKFGTSTALLMIASIPLLKQIGYTQIMLLPVFILPLLAFGITVSIWDYVSKSNRIKIDYFTGLANGYITGIISVLLFSLFILFYLLKKNVDGLLLSPITIAGALLISGVAMSAICSLGAMQYFKNYKLKN